MQEDVNNKIEAKPVLKWAGGKGQLLKIYNEYFPKSGEYKRYIEPFLGGGAVFFYLKPKQAILSDLNEDLINCYQAIKEDPSGLIRAFNRLKFGNDRKSYYEIREKYNSQKLEKTIKAATLIYLNKTCFNGLYRVNSKGFFNVPFGEYKYKQSFFEIENIYAVSKALKKVKLRVGSFEHVEKIAKAGDFVYLDPPYDPIKDLPPNFTKYTKLSFLRNEQYELARIFSKLHKRGCKIMLSNSNTPLINELYGEFKIIKVRANRLINCDGSKRGSIDEVLVINYK